MITHSGGCHCGRVRFEVDAPAELYIDECNCSMCQRIAYLHLIVTPDRFRITQGRDALALYTFNTGTAKHYFCSVCGIYTHHRRRSNPNEYGVNLGTLEGVDPSEHEPIPWSDGVNHPSDR